MLESQLSFERLFPIYVSQSLKDYGTVYYDKLIYYLNELGHIVEEYHEAFGPRNIDETPKVYIETEYSEIEVTNSKDLYIVINDKEIEDDLNSSSIVILPINNELEHIGRLIRVYYQEFVSTTVHPVIKRSLREYNKIYKKVKSYVHGLKALGKEWSFDIKELTLELYEFQERLFKVQDHDEINELLEIYSDTHRLSGLYLSHCPVYNREESLSFPIMANQKNGLYLIVNSNDIEQSDIQSSYVIIFLINALQSFYRDLYPYLSSNKDQIIWQKCFQLIEMPMAVLSDEGELIHHNKHFINLGISASHCMKLNDESKININENFYKIYKKRFQYNSQTYYFFSFQGDDRAQGGLESQELGIITSSIAHELNNPLGGIMATLEFLNMYEDVADELKKDLIGLQEGAQRCLDLVNVFLGFTKSSGHKKSSGSLKESFDHAVGLLRFRIVETNIKLCPQWYPISKYEMSINNSIFTMVFYLLFSELITCYSHFSLVSKTATNTLNFSLMEDESGIKIQLFDDFSFEKKIKSVPLIDYLLEIHNFELEIQSKKIILKGQNL